MTRLAQLLRRVADAVDAFTLPDSEPASPAPKRHLTEDQAAAAEFSVMVWSRREPIDDGDDSGPQTRTAQRVAVDIRRRDALERAIRRFSPSNRGQC